MVSDGLELGLRYQEFTNVSDNPIRPCENPDDMKPRSMPVLSRIFLIIRGEKLAIVPKMPPIDLISQTGSVGCEH